MPQISIITVNLNNKAGLERTVLSVNQQLFKDYEHLIIDGGSTDGSLDIINSYSDQFSYWVSEPDHGIYNAMNKGIHKAKGEYLLFLNSGDYLINTEALSIDFTSFNQDLLIGYRTTITKDRQTIVTYKLEMPKDLGFFVVSSLPHGSTFIRRSLFDSVGFYDESFKIASDWIFFFKAVIYYGASYQELGRAVHVFELGGISTDPIFSCIVKEERERFLSTLMDLEVQSYIKTEFPKIKEFLVLKNEINTLKSSYFSIKQLRGLRILIRLNRLLKKNSFN